MTPDVRNLIWCVVGFSLLAGGLCLDTAPAIGAAFFTTAGLALGFRAGFELGRRFG